jgi:hypothetical protein
MEKQIVDALRAAAREAQAIDGDIVTLPIFNDLTANVKNVEDAARAVRDMKKLRPSLFYETDYARMTGAEFEKREAQFCEGLRKPRPFGPTPFHDLDAARLNDEELGALSRCVGGAVNSWDRGLLTRAQARQKAENAALNPRDTA